MNHYLRTVLAVYGVVGFIFFTYYSVVYSLIAHPVAMLFMILAVDNIYDFLRYSGSIPLVPKTKKMLVLTTTIDFLSMVTAYSIAVMLLPYAYVAGTFYVYLMALLIFYIALTVVEIVYNVSHLVKTLPPRSPVSWDEY